MIKARLIQAIGTRASLRVYWGGQVYDPQRGQHVLHPTHCPNCLGGGRPGYHNARVQLRDSTTLHDSSLGGRLVDNLDAPWPTWCDHCGAAVPLTVREALGQTEDYTAPVDLSRPPCVHYQVFRETLYDNPSGRPEPGDLFWRECPGRWGKEPGPCPHWDNCSGRHLIAILPNGREWDIDGRASNYTMRQDRQHRCWVRQGDPPLITVGKGGHTCAAGAGSIQSGDYHGFLRGGQFT